MPSQRRGFCSDCFKGSLRGDVKPAGTVAIINGLQTYVARPDEGKTPMGIIVILPDAIGWELVNTRALADSYARRVPAVVLLPDVLGRHGVPEQSLATWDAIKNPSTSWWYRELVLRPLWAWDLVRSFVPLMIALRSSVSRPRIYGYIKALRDSPPPPFAAAELKIGVAGFCWGGGFAVALCHGIEEQKATLGEDHVQPLVDCGFAAHPSFVKLPGDVEKVTVPLSIANGDQDMMMAGEKMVLCKKILDSKGGSCEAIVYPGAIHGFAVRGDPNDAKQSEMGLQAEDQAVEWFRKHFQA